MKNRFFIIDPAWAQIPNLTLEEVKVFCSLQYRVRPKRESNDPNWATVEVDQNCFIKDDWPEVFVGRNSLSRILRGLEIKGLLEVVKAVRGNRGGFIVKVLFDPQIRKLILTSVNFNSPNTVQSEAFHCTPQSAMVHDSGAMDAKSGAILHPTECNGISLPLTSRAVESKNSRSIEGNKEIKKVNKETQASQNHFLDHQKNETKKNEVAPLYSFWKTPGIVEESLQTFYVKDCFKGVMLEAVAYGFDPRKYASAEFYRRIVCPELHPSIPLTFKPLDPMKPVQMIFDPQYQWIRRDEFFTSKDYSSPEEGFRSMMAFFPRGYIYKKEKGAPWSATPISIWQDKNQPRVGVPFVKDVSWLTLDSMMTYTQQFEKPDGGFIRMWKANPSLLRRMHWLAGNTAISPSAIMELYPIFKEMVNNPKRMFGANPKKDTWDKFSWFYDWLRGLRKADSKMIPFLRNQQGRWMLDKIGDIVYEGELVGGETHVMEGKNGRTEVYFTDYQAVEWRAQNPRFNPGLVEEDVDTEFNNEV